MLLFGRIVVIVIRIHHALQLAKQFPVLHFVGLLGYAHLFARMMHDLTAGLTGRLFAGLLGAVWILILSQLHLKIVVRIWLFV